MSASGYVHVNVDEVKVETEKAFLVVIDGEDVWLPRACVADADDYAAGDTNCTISVTERFAREKGIEGND